MATTTKTTMRWKHDPRLVFEHPVTRTRSCGAGLNDRACRDCGQPVSMFTTTTTTQHEGASMAEAHAEGWHTPARWRAPGILPRLLSSKKEANTWPTSKSRSSPGS